MRRFRLLLVFALAAAAFWCVAHKQTQSTDKQSSGGPRDSKLLNRGNGPEPESLDPQRARYDSELNILRDTYEGLTTLDEQAHPAPGAASSWTVSSDGKLYTFALRPQARWSNGDPLVAEDFVFALRRLVDPRTASQYAQIVDIIENATDIIKGQRAPETLGVAAPDAHTVTIRLNSPAPYLLGILAHPCAFPVHRPTLQKRGREFSRPGAAVSNGAFVAAEWVVGSHVLARRNPYYWNNDANHLEAVRYRHISDLPAELRLYRAGELDITYALPPAQLQWIREHLPAELHIAPQLTTYYYGFNLQRAPFKDNVLLRRALSMVIDRELLVKSVTARGELPAYSWTPQGIQDYTPQTPQWRELPFPERIAEARKLYAQAGYSAANPLKTQIRYNVDEAHTRIAVVIAAMWKQHLGVQTELIGEETKVLLQNIDRREITQVFRASWIGDYNDPYTFAQYLKSDFGLNLPGYRNPQYDRLLVAAAAQVDSLKRRALLEQAERRVLEDQPLIPLYFYVSKHLVKPWVHGWRDNVMNVQYSKNLSLENAYGHRKTTAGAQR